MTERALLGVSCSCGATLPLDCRHRAGWSLQPAADCLAVDRASGPVASFNSKPQAPAAETPPLWTALHVVGIRVFAETEEDGATALVGDGENVLIPEDGDVMFYGDGGAGKTTLAVDLACHLAAGEDWIGFPIAATATVLLIENEGPRPLFRRKLARKLEGWAGGELEDRIHVLEHPWARLKLPEARDVLAAEIGALEVDVLIVGPVTRFGMDDAGTLREIVDFMGLVADLRRASGRRLTVVLIHHENKGGKVSGAWEGSGDTLFHVQGQGNGHTRLLVQKARWAPAYHQTTLKLRWADGQAYEVEDALELDDETIAERIVAAVSAEAGVGWTKVEKQTTGVGRDRRNQIRDRLLADAVIVNVVKLATGEEVVLDHVPPRKRARLHLASDPVVRNLRRDPGAAAAQAALRWGAGGSDRLRPAPLRLRGAGAGAAEVPPDSGEHGGVNEEEVERLAALARELEEKGS